MSLFLILSVAAALLFATATILAKHFLDLGINDYLFVGPIYCWPFFSAFILLGLYMGGISLSLSLILPAVLAGCLYGVVLIYYLKGLGSEEASRFIPVLSFNTIFLAILSFIFLGESFSQTEYIGMALAVIGAILISVEDINHVKQLHSKAGTMIAISIAILQAFRDLIVDFVTQTVPIWPTLFWMGVGGFILSFGVLLTKRKSEIRAENLINKRNMIFVGSVQALAYVLYATAISIGTAAEASAIIRLNPMFVFIGATALAFIAPNFIEEEKNWSKIIQKLIAATIIILGVILVSQ